MTTTLVEVEVLGGGSQDSLADYRRATDADRLARSVLVWQELVRQRDREIERLRGLDERFAEAVRDLMVRDLGRMADWGRTEEVLVPFPSLATNECVLPACFEGHFVDRDADVLCYFELQRWDVETGVALYAVSVTHN